MKIIPSQLQIVILSPPYTSLQTAIGRYYFSNMCQMKLAGYQFAHGKKSLPLDHYDYLATHLLICLRQNDGNHKVLTGFRSLSYQFCQQLETEFDVISEVNTYANQSCKDALNHVLLKNKTNTSEIFHNSRWTILPEFASQKENKLLLLEVTYLILYMFHNTPSKSEWLCTGINSLNTHKMMYRAGGKDLGESPNFDKEWGFGKKEKLTLIHADLHRDESYIKYFANKHQKLWEQRLVL